MRLRAGAAVLVGLLLALTTSCGGDDDDDAESGEGTELGSGDDEDTSTTEESTTTTLSPEDEVLAAYAAADAAAAAAHDPPDPNHPDLLVHYGGTALERLQTALIQLQGEGMSYVGEIERHPAVTSLVADSATIEDCFVDHSYLVRTATREQISEPGGAVVHIESTLAQVNGAWVIMVEQELSESCTPG